MHVQGERTSVTSNTDTIDRSSTLDGAPQTFWGLLTWRTSVTPDALFLVDTEGRELSFAGYRDEVEQLARVLGGMGVRSGSVVGWQLPTWIDSIVLLGALSAIGATQIPILPLYREHELGHVVTQTQPDFLFVPGTWRGFDYPSLAKQMVELDQKLRVVVVDYELPSGPSGDFEPSLDSTDTRWIYYTSGTTGRPKGARHSDSTVIAAGHSLVECYDLGIDDRSTIAFPVTHVGGIFMLVAGFISGCGYICFENFDVDEAVPLMRGLGVTFPGNGTSFELAYLGVQRRQPGESIFPLARAFPHGGDTKRPHVHAALRDEIGGVGNLSGYGLTEFPMIACGDIRDSVEHLADRVGKPCTEIEVRIVDDSGNVCSPGVEGEILAKGPSLCDGYVDKSANASSFDEDGFFHTGDLGFVDVDGYLEVTGRLKDLIIRKGEKISAAELEEILHANPKIAEVSVIGIPDPDRGERACAVVVLRDPSNPIDLREMGEWVLAKGLMRQKVPEQLEIRPEMPRDFYGKVKKNILREEYA